MKLNSTLIYIFSFVKIMNFSRLTNLVRVEYSYLSNYLWRSKAKGLPWSASVEPVNSCNLKCPQCPTGLGTLTRAKGKISIDEFASVLQNLGNQLIYMMLYLQGEPLLHPQFIEMVTMAHKKRIVTATSTNAQLIDEKKALEIAGSGLDRIIVSLDGIDQETYEKYRVQGDFLKVTQGIRHLTAAKKKLKKQLPLIEVQFLVMRHNEHQRRQVRKFAKSLGADKVSIKSIQVVNFATANEFLPEHPKWNRYRQLASGLWKLKTKPPQNCHRLWNTAVVTFNGDIVSCCYDKNSEYFMGNLHRQTLSEIWHGQKFNLFRKWVRSGYTLPEICNNCGR